MTTKSCKDWEYGDVLICVSPAKSEVPEYFTESKKYSVAEGSCWYEGDIKVVDDDGDAIWASTEGFVYSHSV